MWTSDYCYILYFIQSNQSNQSVNQAIACHISSISQNCLFISMSLSYIQTLTEEVIS